MKISELVGDVEKELLDAKSKKAKAILIKKVEELARAEDVVTKLRENLEVFKNKEVESIRLKDFEY
jgi:hypothetical protein